MLMLAAPSQCGRDGHVGLRGLDVDRAPPERAFGDMKVRKAMQPLGTPLPVPDGQPGEGDGKGPAHHRFPGRDPSTRPANSFL
jgi:hypothetical protein